MHNIILTGVGGSGIVLITRILTRSAVECGLNVKVGESHGLAQRGGSVTSHLRFGSADAVRNVGVAIPNGSAGVLVGFEPAETVRCLGLMRKKDSFAIVNTNPVHAPVHYARYEQYPSVDSILEILKRYVGELHTINASNLAQQAGSRIAGNMVMLGFLIASGRIKELDCKTVKAQIKSSVPKSTINTNLRAFDLGFTQFSARKM